MLSRPLGIYIPSAAGVLLVLLACISIIKLDWRKFTHSKLTQSPMLLILAVSFTYMFVQVFVHDMSLSTPYVQPFLSWIVLSMVVYILYDRHGFIKRLAVAMFLCLLILRPFTVVLLKGGDVPRQTLAADIKLDNANTLAAWLGFCALVFWLWGWNQAMVLKRFLLWAFSILSTFFLMETVSRGGLISLVAGLLVGLRSIPKKKWPVVLVILAIVSSVLYVMSPALFSNYQARMYDESGRLTVWPIAIRAILAEPWLGYGIDQISNRVTSLDNYNNYIVPMSPHNGIILIWLASGAVPALLFILLWYLAILRGYKGKWLISADIDPLPLIVFAFLEMMQNNLIFMDIWSLVPLFYCFMQKPVENDST